MIKFWMSDYKLTPKESLNAVSGTAPRKGCLLRMQWPDQKVGYADVMPWPELGDDSLSQQIDQLKRGRISVLIEQAIWLGRKDALLRSLHRNGLEEVSKVRNHFTIPNFETATSNVLNSAKSMGFNTLKVKVGRDWVEELRWLTRTLRDFNFMVRLDYNSKTDFSTFERMITGLPPGLKQKLEFAEDPFPYDQVAWTEASKIMPLAIDMELPKVPTTLATAELPFKTIILKPARQDVDKALRYAETHRLKVVVTSSMDHPIGISHAVRMAGEIRGKIGNRLIDCGCLTHRLFNDNEYTTKMMTQGPFLTKVPGTGVGFDEILARLPWTPIPINAG